MRRVVVIAALAAAAVATAPAHADFERCCFRVEIEVAGPGWHWRAHHLARYVDHGKIFVALTSAGRRTPLAAFTLRGCARQRLRPALRSFASLEDTLTGGIELVVRSDEFVRAARRCGLRVPIAHAVRPPPLTSFRRATRFSIVRRDGTARVSVRFSYVSPT